MRISRSLIPYLQVAPLALILIIFLGIPLVTVIVVSFFDYANYQVYPDFILLNYIELFESKLTYQLYASMIKFGLIVWSLTLVIGFTVSYFLVFHVRSLLWKIAFFLVCTVPFWTSNIIRMISWIPVLGRQGLVNGSLISLGIIDVPLDFLLFSDFAVIVAYVHLFTLFMIVALFNSMARINPDIIEAAVDAGASRWRVITQIVIPLSKTGIALGSIFVIALVMGDFFVVKIMSGGQSASVVFAMWNEIAMLQYPSAAASSVVLLIIVTLMVAAILRVVNIRKELSG
ncbi:MAG: ABC transporter permease [bacterium]|jgi:putative spermidine/putrescine transport system permease protein|nr:ABC transporter permease [bacterium]